MVQARFINDTTSVEVTSEQQETVVNVTSQTESGRVRAYSAGDHNNLTGRDLTNQHPISAITGLQEALIAVSDKTFVYEQGVASDTWHIVHTLNKRAGCVAVDSAGEVQIPDKIKYISDNEIIATFLAPFAGKAYLN